MSGQTQLNRSAQRPAIGIASRSQHDAEPCADSIERAGGTPFLMLPGGERRAQDLLRGVGGLVVCCSDEYETVGSVGPAVHGDPSPTATALGPFIGPLLLGALERDMPLLAISAAMHALNAEMGGKPARPIPGHGAIGSDDTLESSYHRIYISPGSKLAATVGSGGFVRVNSRHLTGLKEAQKSPLLLASAYSLDDGFIEALESPQHRWVIGVQFHPERRMELPPHFQALFRSLKERADEYLAGRGGEYA